MSEKKKLLGTVTAKELKEIVGLAVEKKVNDDMIHRVLEYFDRDRVGIEARERKFWMKLQKKYPWFSDGAHTINHNTGEVSGGTGPDWDGNTKREMSK